jgi:16S rRNA (guanine527-N7)-methyltransferase
LDLTRLHRFDALVLKHYVDSALPAIMAHLPGPLLDIGTGAGFPGIPIKIMAPELDMILAESRGRRLEFLEEVIAELGLERIQVYPHKVTGYFDRPVAAVITRDLEPVAATLERVSGFLPQGGRVFFLKGPSVDQEMEEADAEWGTQFSLAADQPYQLGTTEHHRRLVIYDRIGEGPVREPGFSTDHITDVASRQNPGFKVWRTLDDGRSIRKHGLALMSGLKQVREVLAEAPERCLALLDSGPDAADVGAPPNFPIYRLRPELFAELDWFGAGAPLALLKVDPIPEWDGTLGPGATLFVPFQDPANVGAVIRTAAAFGVPVVLLQEAAHPYHPKSLRAAGPTIFKAPLFQGPSLADLPGRHPGLLALAAGGTPLAGYDFPESFGLAPGLEGPGLPESAGNLPRLTIPMAPGVESLNAALAAGIALYEWKRSR